MLCCIQISTQAKASSKEALQMPLVSAMRALKSAIASSDFEYKEQHLDASAAIDAVLFIEEVKPVRLHNDYAIVELAAINVLLNSIDNRTLLTGDGEAVAVADTGFDTGSTTDTQPAFTGRVKSLVRSWKTWEAGTHR